MKTAPGTAPAGPNPAQMYLDGLAAASRRPSLNGLRFIVRALSRDDEDDPLAFDWCRVSPADASVLRRRLAGHYAPPTARSYLGAFRSVIKEVWRAGLIDAEARARITDLEPIRGQSDLAGRALELEDFQAMLRTCADDEIGDRDRAALALLYGAGLRRCELADLTIDRLDYRPGRETVKPHGKGHKDRVLPLPPDAVEELRPWLARRGTNPGPLLGYWLRRRLRPLTPHAVYVLVRRRGALAGLDPVPTPHDCRRGYATALHRLGVPLLRISELMGHSSPNTTARYVRQCLDEHRAAVSRLTFTKTRNRFPKDPHPKEPTHE